MTFAIAAVGLGIASLGASNKAARRAARLDAEALAFSKEKYARWLSIYGPIEDTLSEFYNNLTPEFIESQGLQAQEQQYLQAKENMAEFFAVNEISSGTAADLFTKGELQDARDKAQIRADAPFKTAELKQNFLSLGVSGGDRAAGNVINTLNLSASRAGRDAETAANAAGNLFGTAFSISDRNQQNQQNIPNRDFTANEGNTTIN